MVKGTVYQGGGQGERKTYARRINNAVLTGGMAVALALVGSAQAQFQILEDINLGAAGSNTQEVTPYDGGVFFSADDGTNGQELWATGGATTTTLQVEDINPGPAGSFPEELTVFNDVLYFSADNGSTGRELWQTTGLNGSTSIAADLNLAVGVGSEPEELTTCGSSLYFTADNGTDGRQVWEYDGVNPPVMITSGLTNPANLACCGDILYFSASNGVDGTELYIYNSSVLTLVDINSGSLSSSPSEFGCMDTTMFFAATTAADGREPWTSDGTSTGTSLLVNGVTGSVGSNPTQFVARTPTEMVFAADTNGDGREVWVSDGTALNTDYINERTGANKGGDPINMTAVNGIIYMGYNKSAACANCGWEPFAYDGTSMASLISLGTVEAGNVGSNPSGFTEVGGVVYFAADDDATAGRELWATDGTENSSVLAQNINPGAADSNPTWLTAAGGGLFFVATTALEGTEPWYDGTILAVDLNNFVATAETEYSEVILTWKTDAEIDNVGFAIFRANADGSVGELVSNGLIAAEGSETSGANYSFTDPVVLTGADDIRSYYLVDVDLNGVQTYHGPTQVQIRSLSRDSNVADWNLYSN